MAQRTSREAAVCTSVADHLTKLIPALSEPGHRQHRVETEGDNHTKLQVANTGPYPPLPPRLPGADVFSQ